MRDTKIFNRVDYALHILFKSKKKKKHNLKTQPKSNRRLQYDDNIINCFEKDRFFVNFLSNTKNERIN